MLDTDFFRRWMTETASLMTREENRLTELDSPIGDADHGSNLRRGFSAAAQALHDDPSSATAPGTVLTLCGRTLISTVGGASGPLYGTLLRATGKELGEDPEVTREQLSLSLQAGIEAVAALGGAQAGDKTMLDSLGPAAVALQSGFEASRAAAERGAADTVPMLARKGRASYLGERSIGHQDPGATSSALLIAALADVAAARGE